MKRNYKLETAKENPSFYNYIFESKLNMKCTNILASLNIYDYSFKPLIDSLLKLKVLKFKDSHLLKDSFNYDSVPFFYDISNQNLSELIENRNLLRTILENSLFSYSFADNIEFELPTENKEGISLICKSLIDFSKRNKFIQLKRSNLMLKNVKVFKKEYL